MAGDSDIRAGGAYVEIGAKLQPLKAALGQATSMMNAWGAQIAGMGAKMSAAGAAMVAPVVMALKTFASYGNEMANLAASTGLAVQTLAGLRMQALNNNIAFASVKTGIRQMQVAIADGTTETGEAFAKLGLDVSQLRGLAPEQQFEILAERIAQIQDPAEKATAAFRLFGGGGVELIPILNEGAAGMKAAQREASRLGLVLSKDALQKALDTDAALNKLGNALMGLKLRLAEAANGMLPMIDQVSEFIARVGVMLQQNPKLVESFVNIGLAITTAGAAFLALGGAIMAATTPSLLIAGVIIAIGAALLATLDVLGFTRTGFGDLFNAIRIDGTGLATWFGLFVNTLADLWEGLTWSMRISWSVMTHGIKVSVLDVELAFLKMAKVAATAASMLPEKLGGGFGNFTSYAVDQAMERNRAERQQSGLSVINTTLGANGDYRDRSAALKASNEKLLASDPNTGPAWGIDAGRAKEALEKIGGNVGEMLRSMFDSLIGTLPELPEFTGTKSPAMRAAAATGAKSETSFEASGTFLGGYGALMTTNAQLIDLTQRSADAAERTAKATERMAGATDTGGLEMGV